MCLMTSLGLCSWVTAVICLAVQTALVAGRSNPVPGAAHPKDSFLQGASASRRAGRVIAWGSNTDFYGDWVGQATVPHQIASLVNAVDIAAGDTHSVVLLDTGEVKAWGSNASRQLDIPAGLSNQRVIAISTKYNHTVALLENGTVVSWGGDGTVPLEVPQGLADVKKVVAGCNHTLALLANNTVVAWGSNSHNQANVPANLARVVDIGAGCWHSMAVLQDGNVVAWGMNEFKQTLPPPGLNTSVAIDGGGFHSMALLKNGSVVAWGDKVWMDGLLNIPSLAQANVVEIAAGDRHSLARLDTGEVVAWGYNYYNQAAVPRALQHDTSGGLRSSSVRGQKAIAIASGTIHSLAIVAYDGELHVPGLSW